MIFTPAPSLCSRCTTNAKAMTCSAKLVNCMPPKTASLHFPHSEFMYFSPLHMRCCALCLSFLQSKTYPTDGQKWTGLWQKEPVSSLAYLLGSTSTQIGCAIGRCTTVVPDDDGDPSEPTVTPTKYALLFCKLIPAAQENTAPFR